MLEILSGCWCWSQAAARRWSSWSLLVTPIRVDGFFAATRRARVRYARVRYEYEYEYGTSTGPVPKVRKWGEGFTFLNFRVFGGYEQLRISYEMLHFVYE